MDISDIKNSEYMGDTMLAYFKDKLNKMKAELLNQEKEVQSVLRDCANPYDADDIITSVQKRKSLLKDIDEAMERIAQGIYGYCEETGDEIGFSRLDLHPSARYCVDVQERLDKKNRFLQSISNQQTQEEL